MNFDVGIAVAVIVCLVILSVIWNQYFLRYIKENEHGKAMNKKTILSLTRPALCLSSLLVMCSVLLGNSDDEISDALHYIKPSKYAGELLEKMNE